MCMHEHRDPWDRVRPNFLQTIIMGWPLIKVYKGTEEGQPPQYSLGPIW